MNTPVVPATYTACLNEEFVLHLEDQRTQVLVLKAVDLVHDNDDQLAFSLLFAAAAGAPLPQGLYRLSHARLGTIDLFLVPLQRKRDGLSYEAVFNLLKDEAQ